MWRLSKSLQVPESAPFGCIAEDSPQQCEWVSRLLIPTCRGTFPVDVGSLCIINFAEHNFRVYVDCSIVPNDAARVIGISKISIRLKDFSLYGNSKADKQDAYDNRSDPTPTTFEASSSVADAPQRLLSIPKRPPNQA
ncbi:hypothetical protein PspLS_11628 [Pyricularia sp. CBS 133598]|nr:hypothetical protein PspLS_11628 [Pyricularia sp. CBS 133598]